MAKRKKKKRLPTISRLKKRADYLWSIMILMDGQERSPWEGGPNATCQVCLEREAYAAHHVFHKSMHGRVRYDRRNGLPICKKCHFMERRDPAPVVFAAIRYHGCSVYSEFAMDVMATRNRGAYAWNREKIGLVIHALEELISAETVREVFGGAYPAPA